MHCIRVQEYSAKNGPAHVPLCKETGVKQEPRKGNFHRACVLCYLSPSLTGSPKINSYHCLSQCPILGAHTQNPSITKQPAADRFCHLYWIELLFKDKWHRQGKRLCWEVRRETPKNFQPHSLCSPPPENSPFSAHIATSYLLLPVSKPALRRHKWLA